MGENFNFRILMRSDALWEDALPPLANPSGVVYRYECDLCDADYVGIVDTYINALTSTSGR